MITEIKKKFIMTAMIAITILLLAIMIVINVGNIYTTKVRIDTTFDILSNSNGNYIMLGNITDMDEPTGIYMPKSNIDIFLSSNFFVVRYDRFDYPVSIDLTRTQSVDKEKALALANEHLYDDNGRGQDGKYAYLYYNTGFYDDTYAIFLDISDEINNIIIIFVLSLVVALLGWGIMFLIVILLSRMMIRPIASGISKQKEFITNAGHELKTPLAIIQTNTEALELFNGESKYSTNIKKQITRLSDLMNDLLVLTKMDEKLSQDKINEFDISALLSESVDNFTEAFVLKGVKINKDIQDGVMYKGDMEAMIKLFDIFIDNAQKYTSDNGHFDVTLKKAKKLIITFSDTTDEVDEKDIDKLFDRFYRSDTSHNQKGGYGIGLALAKSIITSHNGDISVNYKDHYLTFNIELDIKK